MKSVLFFSFVNCFICIFVNRNIKFITDKTFVYYSTFYFRETLITSNINSNSTRTDLRAKLFCNVKFGAHIIWISPDGMQCGRDGIAGWMIPKRDISCWNSTISCGNVGSLTGRLELREPARLLLAWPYDAVRFVKCGTVALLNWKTYLCLRVGLWFSLWHCHFARELQNSTNLAILSYQVSCNFFQCFTFYFRLVWWRVCSQRPYRILV